MRILFVCLGNICRSPTAEGVMRGLVREAGLEREIEIDSAGTGSWHIGDPPDSRAVSAAARRGVDLDGAARQVTAADFAGFDLVIAMDRSNREMLEAIAPDAAGREKVRLLREYGDGEELDVPDPYYGGPEGFDEVLAMIERSCAALLTELRAERPA